MQGRRQSDDPPLHTHTHNPQLVLGQCLKLVSKNNLLTDLSMKQKFCLSIIHSEETEEKKKQRTFIRVTEYYQASQLNCNKNK